MNKTVTPTLEELQREEYELRARADADLAALQRRRESVVQVVNPLGKLLDRRSAIVDRITNSKKSLEFLTTSVTELRRRLWEAFNTDNMAPRDVTFLLDNNPHLTLAPFILAEMELWLAEKRTEIAPIDEEILSYARAHGLEDRLPPELAAKLVTPPAGAGE